jgi:hypothetical protein
MLMRYSTAKVNSSLILIGAQISRPLLAHMHESFQKLGNKRKDVISREADSEVAEEHSTTYPTLAFPMVLGNLIGAH